MLKEFFTFSGRLNRLRAFGYQLILSIPMLIIKAIIENTLSTVTLVICIILSLIFSVSGISINVRRLHDIEHSGWFSLLLLVPLIGFILSLILLFKKGTHGTNEYGDDPLLYN